MTTLVTGEKQARDTDPKASQHIKDAAQILERKLRNMNLWNVDTEKEMSKFIEDL